MFRQDLERASTMPVSLYLKPPYSGKVAAKQFPLKYKAIKFRVSIDPFSNDTELYAREFSKSLMDQVYTRYHSLKPGSIQD